MATIQETLHPPEPRGTLTWIRQNLFNNWYNSLLTLLSLAIVYWAAVGVTRWVFITADWRPVTTRPLLYLVGQYPREQLWRVGASLLIVSTLLGMSWGVWGGIMRTFAIALAAVLGAGALIPTPSGIEPIAFHASLLANPALTYLGYQLGRRKGIRGHHVLLGWGISAIVTLFLLRGLPGVRFLAVVETDLWGGLLVNLLLAVAGIGLSFPIGVLLALGRRSSLPVVRLISTLVIELVRGVPLVSILFMSSIILALFLPPDLRIDRLIRAMAGMTIFSAAYVAENVRGGLQAVAYGQEEAAKALGFNNFQTTLLIILPQALRISIPNLVGQFISLFKDTTLAVIIAINEMLFIGKSIVNANPEFIQLQAEVYIFIATVFWVLSYVMSYASLRLEAALGVGER